MQVIERAPGARLPSECVRLAEARRQTAAVALLARGAQVEEPVLRSPRRFVDFAERRGYLDRVGRGQISRADPGDDDSGPRADAFSWLPVPTWQLCMERRRFRGRLGAPL